MAKMTAKERDIQKYMKTLSIPREKAEELYAFDNDEIGNEVVDKIEAKEKEVQQEKEKRSSIEKVKYMKAKVKGDANKENIIDDIMTKTASSDHVFNCQHMTATKMSFQDQDGNFYTVQVTKHKSRPNGYNADLMAQDNQEKAE